MNSRKWQVGMVAVVVLTGGLGAFAPFVWRFLRLEERAAAGMAAGVLLLQALWFGLSAVTGEANGSMGDNIAGLFGALTIMLAIFGAIWQFRPLNKVEKTDDWSNYKA